MVLIFWSTSHREKKSLYSCCDLLAFSSNKVYVSIFILKLVFALIFMFTISVLVEEKKIAIFIADASAKFSFRKGEVAAGNKERTKRERDGKKKKKSSCSVVVIICL